VVKTYERTYTRGEREPNEAELRVIMRCMKRYLCDSSDPVKPHWGLLIKRLASRMLGVYASGGSWTLGNGWQSRLTSAGLDEECNVIDAEKWERAFRQLLERRNYDPARQAVEEAMEAPKKDLSTMSAQPKEPAPVTMRMGKTLSFKNAQGHQRHFVTSERASK
jgi:hypothetical protein